MPHKNIRFHYNGSKCIRTPPKKGVNPDGHINFVVTPGTKVTLNFGEDAKKILTPVPPGRLTLCNPRGPDNSAVRYDIVTDAYDRLGLGEIDLPFDLDVTVFACGPYTSAAVTAAADEEEDLRGHDIIMELC